MKLAPKPSSRVIATSVRAQVPFKAKNAKLTFTTNPNTDASWDPTMHQNNGNFGLADGSATQATVQILTKQVTAHMNSLGSNTCTLQFP